MSGNYLPHGLVIYRSTLNLLWWFMHARATSGGSCRLKLLFKSWIQQAVWIPKLNTAKRFTHTVLTWVWFGLLWIRDLSFWFCSFSSQFSLFSSSISSFISLFSTSSSSIYCSRSRWLFVDHRPLSLVSASLYVGWETTHHMHWIYRKLRRLQGRYDLCNLLRNAPL